MSGDQLRTIETTARQSMRTCACSSAAAPRGRSAALEPQASLADLALRLESAEASVNASISRRSAGAPLPPAASLGAYRILQETLTNARRHGAPGVTRLRMSWSDATLGLEVTNPVRRDRRAEPPGLGVHGMVERAQLFGVPHLRPEAIAGGSP